MILVIDNYDSFVHNLARYFRQLGVGTRTLRNDQLTIAEIESMAPQAIVISPGPCTPDEAGISLDVVTELAGRTPVFGVCLGHQAIVQALGGSIVRAEPMHGRSSEIEHNSSGVFEGLESPISVGRYHSLIADQNSIPDSLTVSARCGEIVMAVEHNSFPVVGVQFHPESVLTNSGYRLISNFLCLAGIEHDVPGVEKTSASRTVQSAAREEVSSSRDASRVFLSGDRP